MKFKIGLLMVILMSAIMFSSCKIKTVPSGYVAVEFKKFGSEKGIKETPLEPGVYPIGLNADIYLLPTFTQNYVWTHDSTEGSPTDESFNFQDIQGLDLNADIGITYHIEQTKAATIFQKYRRGIDEITDLYLRNMVRDALVKRASNLDVAVIYGPGKTELIGNVQKDVAKQCEPIGIIIENVYWIGRIKVPDTVKKAIDSKIEATQIALQRENELRATEAEAAKKVATAKGEAEALLAKSEAEAKSNKMVSASISSVLVEYKKAEKWDGHLPQVTGGSTPLLNLNTK